MSIRYPPPSPSGHHSPQNRLRLGLVADVLGEPLQEFRVLPLVDRPEYRGRGPPPGVDDRAVGQLGSQVFPSDVLPSAVALDDGVADEADRQAYPETAPLIFWGVRVLGRLVADYPGVGEFRLAFVGGHLAHVGPGSEI